MNIALQRVLETAAKRVMTTTVMMTANTIVSSLSHKQLQLLCENC